ncbi:NAD(P)/FAD-dependent oxidoreductase [Streptomyces sp. JJ36]|uniref:NAD(P)/FAD-dependent oxidoreductase n=1 Tax=Streptomyces sp. JJ36 TaxID=2736645 RepID=UPI001F28539F|nr:FAD-dependent oxidoreductase [Streptomyces sp. JJ36]MCF6521776.1 NAD(P)/FAD-dependent oxidoreductase [Streptomyces sp. JJ36]
MTSKKRVVVIGGGMAGARLAQQLGTAGDRVDLTVVGEEPHPAYNRVLLAEVLAGRYAPEVAALPEGVAGRRLRGVRAVRIDRAERRVLCDDGAALPYDALVLATGSNPVLPPLRGLFPADAPAGAPADGAAPGGRELPEGVSAFRTLDDCLSLAAAVRTGTRAVVIGGGLLGVSAARALAARGAQVVLAQQGEHLMERHLDAEASGLLRRHLESLGVEVHTGCRVRGLRTRPADGAPAGGTGGAATVRAAGATRAVRAVELADGYRLDCELVVLACGVRPRTGLARAAGLAVARGVVVDDELRTGDPRIHAIGDCAEHAGVLYGLAGAAQDQADVLARLLTGQTLPGGARPRYTGTRALTRLTLAAPAAASPGTPGAAASALTGPGPDSGASAPAGPGAPASAPPAPGAADTAHPANTAGTAAPEGTAVPPVPPGGAPGTGAATAAGAGAPGTAPGPGAAPGPLDLAAFGETEPGTDDDVLHLHDATRRVYRKVVVRGDRLVGGILLGDLATVGTLARTWEEDAPLPGAPAHPLLHLLTPEGGH